MSFTISTTKIEELLKTTEANTTSHAGNMTSWYPSVSGGTIFAPVSLVTAGTRDHLLSYRRKIEGAGIPLVSADDLESELDAMRR